MIFFPTIVYSTRFKVYVKSKVFRMHSARHHPNCILIGILLTSTTLTWFALLLEKGSPWLEDLNGFIKEFQARFGNTTLNPKRSNNCGEEIVLHQPLWQALTFLHVTFHEMKL